MSTKNKIIYWAVALVVLAGITLALNAWAVVPSDFGLTEGNTISATGSNDPDVYIVNDSGYKRLFLNPVIFGFYGHLGGFANVKSVSPATRDAFLTSGLFQLFGDQKVYGVEATGEDTGVLHWVNTTGAQAVADDSNFFKKVFVINQNEFNWYAKGADYTSVNQIPNYSRDGVIVPVQTNVAVLSSDNLASQTVPSDAKNVKILSVDFKGNGTVDKLVLRRMGFVQFDKYDNVYLYKDGKYLETNSNKNNDTATFNNLNLTAPFKLDVVVDFVGVQAGSPAQVKLEGDYNGLPLVSNTLLFASVNSGKFELNASATPVLDKVIDAQVGAKIADFTASVSNDQDVYLRHFELSTSGGIDVSNPKLVIDSVNYVGIVSGDKLIFNPNILMKKDRIKTIKVYGDISSSNSDTLKVYLAQPQDMIVEGAVYGFGVSIVNDPLTNLNLTNAKLIEVVADNKGTLSSKVDSALYQPAILLDTSKNDVMKFELDANDEPIELSIVKITLDQAEEFVGNAYLYDGSTKVAEVNPNGNVLEFDANGYKITDKITLVLKVDVVANPDEMTYVATPVVVSVKGYGTNSGKEIVATLSGSAKSVYVYSAIPKVVRTDTISDNSPITSSSVPRKVLSFSVSAVGGDIELSADSFNFALTQVGLKLAKVASYSLELDGQEVASGSFVPTSTSVIVSFPEKVEILKGDTKEFIVYVDFSNFKVIGEREFMLELKNVSDNIKWSVKDVDGDYTIAVESVLKTLTQLPIQSADFYSYNN